MDSPLDQWPTEKIKELNTEILSRLRHRGNVYAIFVKASDQNSEWVVKYVGERKAVGLRDRITQHIIKKDEQTGSKLTYVQAAVGARCQVGLSIIKVEPESLRLFLEETIISNHKDRLPWNTQG